MHARVLYTPAWPPDGELWYSLRRIVCKADTIREEYQLIMNCIMRVINMKISNCLIKCLQSFPIKLSKVWILREVSWRWLDPVMTACQPGHFEHRVYTQWWIHRKQFSYPPLMLGSQYGLGEKRLQTLGISFHCEPLTKEVMWNTVIILNFRPL